MRTAWQLLLILLVCAAGCFLLYWTKFEGPVFISGTAINVMNGRPVANAKIRFKDLNGSTEAATTDAAGHFTYWGKRPYYCCSLYASASGLLLQTLITNGFLGRGLAIYSGLVVPFIPSTELSGHVYDERGKSLSGCEVQALTYLPQDQHWDPKPGLQTADTERTDRAGGYRFTRLGADRYSVLAQCGPSTQNSPYHGEESSRFDSWRPMLYRQANSLSDRSTITLRPGERVSEVDFRLRASTWHAVSGFVTFSDGSVAKKRPTTVYSHDLRATILDPEWVGVDISAPCDWRTPTDEFTCNLLSGFVYNLHFQVDGVLWTDSVNWRDNVNVRPQQADIQIRVPEGARIPRLNVRLTNSPQASPAAPKPPPLPTGTLRIYHKCPGNKRDTWIGVRAYDRQGALAANRNSWVMYCSDETVWTLAAGEYRLVCSVFYGTGRDLKIEELLKSHAQRVTVRPGTASEVRLKIWTRDEVIRLALDSL